MDTFTQAALGAVIAEAGFRDRLGRRAVLFGAVCGLAPDLDMVVAVAGDWAPLVHHRGMSHSLLLLPLVALGAGALGWHWTGRQTSWRHWVHLAFWALWTHPLLDLCTTYGTQLLAPFSDERFALDAVSIVDLHYSVPLVAVVVAGLRRTRTPRLRFWAAGVLAVTAAYLLLGAVLSRHVQTEARARLQERGFAASEVRALPTLGNLWLWRVVARDEAGNLAMGIDSVWVADDFAPTVLERPTDPLVDAALRSERGALFAWFSMGMLRVRVERGEDGSTVFLEDVRFGLVTAPELTPFSAAARFDAGGRLLEVERLPGDLGDVAVGHELATMWSLMWGTRSP